jgi:hypothetical protein
MSPWLVSLFFVPSANLLFFAVAPLTRPRAPAISQAMPSAAPYRTTQGETKLAAGRRRA